MRIIFLKKTLELLKDQFLQFSQWKNNSITNVMREKYKVGNNGIKKEVVNNIYKLMMLSDKRKVFFINKNHTATVMNEKDIKTSIRMFFRPSYDVNISGIEKFKTSMTKVKSNLLVNNVHKSWCEHLVKNNDNNYDMSLSYDLCNHVQVLITKPASKKSKTLPNTSSTLTFHGRFSVISTLLTPIKLRIYNCSHIHRCESVVHRGSMIDIIIPTNCFILLHCALIHCGSPSWFIESGSYHQNTRSFFTIVENNYHVVNKRTETILPDQFLIWRHVRFVLIISMVWLAITAH